MTATRTPQRNHNNLRESPDGLGREKRCALCREWWPADDEFYSSNARNGLAYWCKACSVEVQRASRKHRRAAAAAATTSAG